MRLWIVTVVALAFAQAAFGQSNLPPVWDSFDGPNVVYAETGVIFGIGVSPGYGLTVELVAGPPNVNVHLSWDRDWFAAFFWNVPRSAVGTTNVFIARITDTGNPPLSATNVFSIAVIGPPPIRAIRLSNNVPVLDLDNLLPDKEYRVEYSPCLCPTNWTLWVTVPRSPTIPRPPVLTLVDTNSSAPQRFYRLLPSYECHIADCP